jgi:hypothetical protein
VLLTLPVSRSTPDPALSTGVGAHPEMVRDDAVVAAVRHGIELPPMTQSSVVVVACRNVSSTAELVACAAREGGRENAKPRNNRPAKTGWKKRADKRNQLSTIDVRNVRLHIGVTDDKMRRHRNFRTKFGQNARMFTCNSLCANR